MSFSKAFCADSPFHQKNKKSRKQAKEDYISTETANSVSVDDDLDTLVNAENKAAESYKNLTWKEKKALKKS